MQYKAVEIIKKFEGCSLTAYKCPGDVWTIGYGTTEGVKEGDSISPEMAEYYLMLHIKKDKGFLDKTVKVPITDNMRAALLSFVYNVGQGAFLRSTLLMLLNDGKYMDAANEFLRWHKASGRRMLGLVRRRVYERMVFLSPD